MNQPSGTFIWYELAARDPRAAAHFYESVVGWTASGPTVEGVDYTHLSAGPAMVGGIAPIPENACAAHAKGGWAGYIGVADVDAHAARVKELGGSLVREPADLPGVGRLAVAADPYGALFMLFKGAGEQGPVPAPAGTPGHIGWHELHAGDGEGAFAFYSALFGWTQADAMDMGPMGLYRIFAAGGPPVGGMLTRTPDSPGPLWLYYFNVEAIDAAVARVAAAGGRIIMGPHEVPGGSWIAQGLDPQGSLFALVAPVRG